MNILKKKVFQFRLLLPRIQLESFCSLTTLDDRYTTETWTSQLFQNLRKQKILELLGKCKTIDSNNMLLEAKIFINMNIVWNILFHQIIARFLGFLHELSTRVDRYNKDGNLLV